MALFQLVTPFNMCILFMHINRRILLAQNVPQEAAPTWVTNQMAAMECVVVLVTAGRLFVATAVFTKDVWTTTTAVQGMAISVIPALLA